MSQRVRRSGRITKEVPILLIGNDTEGKVFSEETKTVVLSRHGAGIVSRHKLAAEDEIIIRSHESNKEAIAHVVGQIGFDNGVYGYGVAFADPSIHFWNTLLPPPTPEEMLALRLAFHCSACGERVTLENAEEAADVYAINDGVVRFCDRCGYSTMWKLAPEEGPFKAAPAVRELPRPEVPRHAATDPSPSRASLPAPPVSQETSEHTAYSASAIALDDCPVQQHAAAATPPPVATVVSATPSPATTTASPGTGGSPINRRKYVRARVTFAACIRSAEFGDDITVCEDISRGGLRFKSRKHYPIGAKIEVAVPYSRETQSFFVRGRVVFVQDLPDQSMTRHGVCYLSAAET
jgi:hypothetical protein